MIYQPGEGSSITGGPKKSVAEVHDSINLVRLYLFVLLPKLETTSSTVLTPIVSMLVSLSLIVAFYLQ